MRFIALSRKEHRGAAFKSDNSDFAVVPGSNKSAAWIMFHESLSDLARFSASPEKIPHLRTIPGYIVAD